MSLDHHYLVCDSNNELWHFYIENESIFYELKKKDSFNNKVKLVDDIKLYDITMHNNYIYLICVTNSGLFSQWTYKSGKWEEKVIKKFNPSGNTIDFIKIFSSNKTFHIFYSYRNLWFRQNNRNQKEYLFHINSNISHIENAVCSITTPDNNSKYFVDVTNSQRLICFYTHTNSNIIGILTRSFSLFTNKWSFGTRMNFTHKPRKIYSLFIDSNDDIHIIYTPSNQHAIHHSVYTRKYQSKGVINIISSNASSPNILLSILEINQKLFIVWKDSTNIYFKSSDDFGTTWSDTTLLTSYDYLEIRYIGSTYKDKSISKSISTFGYIKNTDIFLCCLDDNKIKNDKDLNQLDIYDKDVIMIDDILDTEIDDSSVHFEDEIENTEEITLENEYKDLDKNNDNTFNCIEEINGPTLNDEETIQNKPKSFIDKVMDFFNK